MLLSRNFLLSQKYNYRRDLLLNFKVIGQSYTPLIKVEKLDACMRPLFTNLVTIIYAQYQLDIAVSVICLAYSIVCSYGTYEFIYFRDSMHW